VSASGVKTGGIAALLSRRQQIRSGRFGLPGPTRPWGGEALPLGKHRAAANVDQVVSDHSDGPRELHWTTNRI